MNIVYSSHRIASWLFAERPVVAAVPSAARLNGLAECAGGGSGRRRVRRVRGPGAGRAACWGLDAVPFQALPESRGAARGRTRRCRRRTAGSAAGHGDGTGQHDGEKTQRGRAAVESAGWAYQGFSLVSGGPSPSGSWPGQAGGLPSAVNCVDLVISLRPASSFLSGGAGRSGLRPCPAGPQRGLSRNPTNTGAGTRQCGAGLGPDRTAVGVPALEG
jgi:hypothetical protein